MSASTKGYRIAGEAVTDAVGEEFGRLIAERDRLVNSATVAEPYREALQKLMAVHEGFPDGPCLCAAHENAHELLAGDGTPGPAPEAAPRMSRDVLRRKIAADVWEQAAQMCEETALRLDRAGAHSGAATAKGLAIDLRARAAAPLAAPREPSEDDDTTVEFLEKIIDYFEQLRHRAKVRGGPDTSAMQLAKEAIGVCREALDDAAERRALRAVPSVPPTEPPT